MREGVCKGKSGKEGEWRKEREKKINKKREEERGRGRKRGAE